MHLPNPKHPLVHARPDRQKVEVKQCAVRVRAWVERVEEFREFECGAVRSAFLEVHYVAAVSRQVNGLEIC